MPEYDWPLGFQTPHGLPRTGEKLPRRLAVVEPEVSPGRDILVRYTARKRFPTRVGLREKFRLAAIEDRLFARIRTDRDRCVRCTRLRERGMFVIDPATQKERVTWPQLAEGMLESVVSEGGVVEVEL